MILAYHNVVPDAAVPSGDLANHIRLSAFVAQLDSLRQTHDVVPLAETLRPAPPGSHRPRVAITFDDAYRGALLHAVPELVRRDMPATVFVAPAFLGGKSFWWDALATPGIGLNAAFRDHALDALRGEDGAIRAWAARSGRTIVAVPDVQCVSSTDELLRAATLPGISLASHTWSHPNLTRLAATDVARELARPLAWLRSMVANPLPWIAYPYGLHNQQVDLAAAAAGYEGALGIRGGWLPAASRDRFALPRLNIPPGLTMEGFVLRAAGLLAG